MEGGVYQLEAVGYGMNGLGVSDHGHDLLQEGLIGLIADHFDQAGLYCLVVVHAADAGKDVDLLQLRGDGGGVVGRQLGAVFPVDLVAVVLLGVVAGGNVDACLAVVVAHGEAQLRRRPQGFKDPDVDAVAGAHLGGGPGKVHTVETAVHGDGDTAALGLFALGTDHVGKALGGVPDDIDVHLVQAHLHGATQSGGTKFQGAVEPAFDLLGVIADRFQLCLLVRGQHTAGEPFFIFLHIIHRFRILLFLDRAGRGKAYVYAYCSKTSAVLQVKKRKSRVNHGFFLLMISGTLLDLESAIDLLQEHDSCQMVREGHG